MQPLPPNPLPGSERDTPLVVDLDGFEGPLDVLLALARTQKVDIARLSILQLADQYITFITEARRLSLEVAADYLVMAAWLAYLKSRLLLPLDNEEEELSGPEQAAQLAFRLQRLDAMRDAASKLMNRHRLGRDVFSRGNPEGIRNIRHANWEVSLFELISAYGNLKRTQEPEPLRLERIETYSIEEALSRLSASLGMVHGWERLESFLPSGILSGFRRKSAVASTLLAGLELSRQGRAALRQEQPFGPIYLKPQSPRDS